MSYWIHPDAETELGYDIGIVSIAGDAIGSKTGTVEIHRHTVDASLGSVLNAIGIPIKPDIVAQ